MAVTDGFWPETRCLQLIREYKARSLLWDHENPLFHNRKLKQVAWQHIGKVLNTTAKACRSKMCSLNASFNREKLKVLRSLNSDTGIYRSRWYAYKEMVSMFPKRNKRQVQKKNECLHNGTIKKILQAQDVHTSSGVSASFDVSTSTASSESNTMINDEIEFKIEPSSDSEVESVIDSSESVSPNLCQVETVTIPSVVPKLHRESGPVEFTEELGNVGEVGPFMLFVQSKMKKYSPQTLTAVQRAICDILFKADEEYYMSTASGESSLDPVAKNENIFS